MNYIDLHCDTIYELVHHPSYSFTKNPLCINLEKLKQAHSMAQFFACFLDAQEFDMNYDRAFDQALYMLQYMKDQFAPLTDTIAIACSFDDLQKNAAAGKISGIFTVEEGGILNHDLSRLDALYEKGIRLITLFWNYPNSLGAANHPDPSIMNQGLSSFGFEVVEQMNHLGMLIDVSHASDGSFWDIIRTSKTPILASHSNARAICSHRRNLSDEMLHALGEKGGIVGMNFFPAFVSDTCSASVDDLIRHAHHIVDHAGMEALAIGSDFDGFDGELKDLESADKTENLRKALLRGGFTESQTDFIFYKNAARLIYDVL